VLTNAVRLAEAFRRAGSFVVLVNVHSVDGKDRLHPLTGAGFPLPAERPKDWAELARELGPQPLDHLIPKHQRGAFFGTDLDLQVRRRKIETIFHAWGVYVPQSRLLQHSTHQNVPLEATTHRGTGPCG
jgi:nicotinamidase-related amidase